MTTKTKTDAIARALTCCRERTTELERASRAAYKAERDNARAHEAMRKACAPLRRQIERRLKKQLPSDCSSEVHVHPQENWSTGKCVLSGKLLVDMSLRMKALTLRVSDLVKTERDINRLIDTLCSALLVGTVFEEGAGS